MVGIAPRPSEASCECKLLTCWSDADITVGSDWRREIERALERTKVALLLVSPSFLSSDFISNHELPHLLKAALSAELRVFWIPLSHSLYQHTEINAYQAAHDPAHPLESLRKAQRNVALGFEGTGSSQEPEPPNRIRSSAPAPSSDPGVRSCGLHS